MTFKDFAEYAAEPNSCCHQEFCFIAGLLLTGLLLKCLRAAGSSLRCQASKLKRYSPLALQFTRFVAQLQPAGRNNRDAALIQDHELEGLAIQVAAEVEAIHHFQLIGPHVHLFFVRLSPVHAGPREQPQTST